ncbi:Site-specific recombinase XerD [Flavobacteriaceae bacterium MAR_2010_188]|nr:Site-specific recombinase XerD [Flavobacteriaceae bacterium MAR_2010_188]
MESRTTISIYLDTRRKKSGGKFPVKLRVYSSETSTRKYYSTVFDMTKMEYKKIWLNPSPTGEVNKDIKTKLLKVQTKADEIIRAMEYFTFHEFEKQMYRKKGEGDLVKYHYVEKIKKLMKRNQISTANSYELAQKSFIAYVEAKNLTQYDKMLLKEVNVEWLEGYELYMLDEGKSPTTVSIYVRTLRAIYKSAIPDFIDASLYPFGLDKYQPPEANNKKKSLEKSELKVLFNSEPMSLEQQKAKDFWFLSYSCNGMNIKDIANLRYKDIKGDYLVYERAKTRTTKSKRKTEITVYLNDFDMATIDKYGIKSKDSKSLIFDIIVDTNNALLNQRKIKNFTKFINQHIKILAKNNGITPEISSNWARHSYASQSVDSGASVVDVMESLGHSNILTTQNYLKSLNNKKKREREKSLMDF